MDMSQPEADNQTTIPLRGVRRSRAHQTPDEAQLLCHRFWPSLLGVSFVPKDGCTRLAEFACRQVSKIQALVPDVTEENVVEMVAWVRNSSDEPLQEVVHQIQAKLRDQTGQVQDADVCARVLELVAALLSSLCVRVERNNTSHLASDSITWGGNKSLRTAVEVHFETKQKITLVPEPTFRERLTVPNLVRSYGFNVVWTDDINKHLDIHESSKTLFIYEHKLLLYAQTLPNCRSIPNRKILEECLDTLSLLFPYQQRRTVSFLGHRKRRRRFHRLGNFNRIPSREAKDYPHWGYQLHLLSVIIDRPYTTVVQQLYDAPTRFLAWFDSWVAFSAMSFALFFSVVALVLAYLSYQVSVASLDVSNAQYLLSLAQACSDPQQPDSVRQICDSAGAMRI